ncbi:unnamed protein product [Microthlaspi erraticum]|uniref:RRM domain-containing protein n=1 Tax=Microthlaspi erraticum TaxID=1685480 RepID=A0A6D2KJ56_9BRAS|nr:unnamed protein product [Microthlaspi erraticum]
MAVSKEEFNAFHKIDRTLFFRLVFVLNRDMNQSYEVFAFLYLLEQMNYARNVVSYVVSLPDAFIDAVANEIVACLSFLYNKDYATLFVANNTDDHSVIPLVMRITGGRLTIKFINQSRDALLLGVRKNLSDICTRAFDDMCVRAERYYQEILLAIEREKVLEDLKNIRLSSQQATINRQSVQQERVLTPTLPPSVEDEANKIDTETDQEVKTDDGEVVVAADDRTVFLTFSKGYPISEEEVRVYFTRKFGEVIDAVEMQEVEDNEQPLFARMVMKTEHMSMIEEIVTVRNRNKFTIDGKHVWARKYVRKNANPSAASTSSSQI